VNFAADERYEFHLRGVGAHVLFFGITCPCNLIELIVDAMLASGKG